MKRYKRFFILMLAGALLLICGCGDGKNHPGSMESQLEIQMQLNIIEIDVRLPENEKYRDWLKKYQSSEHYYGNLPEPSTKQQKRPDDKKFKEWLRKQRIGLAGERDSRWQTWDWSSGWKLEMYLEHYDNADRHVLRARNENSGEVHVISEIFNLADYTDGVYSSPTLISIVDDTHVLYHVDTIDNPVLYLYTLGQGSECIGGFPISAVFADKECTLLCWRDYYERAVYRADLKQLAKNGTVLKLTGLDGR